MSKKSKATPIPLPSLSSPEELTVDHVRAVGYKAKSDYEKRSKFLKFLTCCYHNETIENELIAFQPTDYKPYQGWMFLLNHYVEENVKSEASSVAEALKIYFKAAFGPDQSQSYFEMRNCIIQHFINPQNVELARNTMRHN